MAELLYHPYNLLISIEIFLQYNFDDLLNIELWGFLQSKSVECHLHAQNENNIELYIVYSIIPGVHNFGP